MSDKEFSQVKRWLTVAARVVVGVVFILSGCTKMIDLWGFMFKIEEYLAVWHFDVPRPLIVAGGGMLSLSEFIVGMSILLGCYRRIALYLVTAMMAVMLPLTVYIAVENPVADCGCFGDWLVISNGATLLKNIVIAALIGWLWVGNGRVDGVIPKSLQWVTSTLSGLYMIVIGVIGFEVQPLVDFRPYADGRSLIADEEGEDSADTLVFVYEKDGERREFTGESLPDDTWTFVERRGDTGVGESLFMLTDEEGDQYALGDIIEGDRPELLVLIPDVIATDPSMTITINDLGDAVASMGGTLAAIIGYRSGDEIQEWRDFSLANYPIYTADPTDIKIMARGQVALVMVDNGRVYWKRRLESISGEALERMSGREFLMDELRPRGLKFFMWLTVVFTILQMIVAFPGFCRWCKGFRK